MATNGLPGSVRPVGKSVDKVAGVDGLRLGSRTLQGRGPDRRAW